MSKYFSIEELTRSYVASRNDIDNTPTPVVLENLNHLANNLLDPIRDLWGKPIVVNSGYRSPALNKAVGGVGNSNHLDGYAADITTGSKNSNLELFEMIKSSNLTWDELIDEANGRWIHVAMRKVGNRRKVLRL